MMKRSISFVLTLLLLSSACSHPERTNEGNASKDVSQSSHPAVEYLQDEEEYQVYSAILKNEVRGNGIDKIIIANHTFRETFDREEILRHGKSGKSFLQNLSGQIIEDFDRKNKSEYLLSNKIPPVRNFNLILFDERSFFSQQNVTRAHAEWISFFKRFPNAQGLFSFSRVGFDESRNKALVYISNSAGVESAAGALAYLEKRRGAWVVVRSLQLWVT